ncbi:MAG: hypothetical protein ACPGWS_07800, partial [Solirubrobacterales bacterium]
MSRTRAERLRALERFFEDRYVDFAIRFAEVAEIDGKPQRTGKVSRVFGGVWDKFAGEWVSDREPQQIEVWEASKAQWDFVLDDCPQPIAIGARGSGKSEGGTCRVGRLSSECGGLNGIVTAPTADLTVAMYSKILARMPDRWVAKTYNSNQRREIVLAHGGIIKFRSTNNPDSIRSFGAAWAHSDEAQDSVGGGGLENTWFCLRLSNKPRHSYSLTLKRKIKPSYDKWAANKSCRLYHMSKSDNPWIPKAVYEIAADGSFMDPATYAMEAEARWPDLSDKTYPWFDRKTHVHKVEDVRKVCAELYGIYPEIGRDITSQVTKARTGRAHPYIAGNDFDVAAAMCCAIFRVFATPAGMPDLWWQIDELRIERYGSADRMGVLMRKRGYGKAVAIVDASGQYMSGAGSKPGTKGRSHVSLLKSAGIRVIVPGKKNPPRIDRINTVNSKFRNAHDQITAQIDPKCRHTIEAFENQQNDPKKGLPKKDLVNEHPIDAYGYPVHYVCDVSRARAAVQVAYAR